MTAPSVDEALRIQTLNRNFVAKALGVYAQDLFEVAPNWKILAGARWDQFDGRLRQPGDGDRSRDHARRAPTRSGAAAVGVLYQPSDKLSFYASYGTSFNTSGELYNYDARARTRRRRRTANLEAGVKSDLFDGNLSARAAMFQTTKYNERNRDSPDGVPLDDLPALGQAPRERRRASTSPAGSRRDGRCTCRTPGSRSPRSTRSGA